MASIKHALTERWYAWENARQAAMEDEEVNLYADNEKGEQAYLPREVELDDLPSDRAGSGDEPRAQYIPPPPPPPIGRGEAKV